MGKNRNKRLLHAVLFCMHRPMHSESAVGCAMKLMKEADPTDIILGGDFADFKKISAWSKRRLSELTEVSFQAEVDEGEAFLARLRRQHPKARIRWREGNHENRLERYLLGGAKELSSLRCLRIPELYHLADYDIEYTTSNISLADGQFLVKHGCYCGERAGVNELLAEGKSGMCSHNHRERKTGRTFRDQKPLFWFHGACLCNLHPDYISEDVSRNWQHGVNFVETKGKLWHADQVSINRGLAFWRGKEFRA